MWLFAKGVLSRSYFWLFALLLDPLDFYNRFKPPSWPGYDVNLEAFFYVLGGLIFWTSFLTFDDLRKQVGQAEPDADMPLYRACRWIARDSVWAARYPRSRDQEWVSLVDAELMSKANLGRVELFGVPRDRGGALYRMPDAFKENAQWHSNKLASDEPPTHMWASARLDVDPSIYYDVKLDSRQVKRVWPRKGFWARLWRVSPVERVGNYTQMFRLQDGAYSKQYGFFEPPIEGFLRERLGK